MSCPWEIGDSHEPPVVLALGKTLLPRRHEEHGKCNLDPLRFLPISVVIFWVAARVLRAIREKRLFSLAIILVPGASMMKKGAYHCISLTFHWICDLVQEGLWNPGLKHPALDSIVLRPISANSNLRFGP